MMHFNALLRRMLPILALLLCGTLSAQNTRYWVGGDGAWNDAAHWSDVSGGVAGAGVPSANDDVWIAAGNDLDITISADAQCHDLHIDASHARVQLDGDARKELNIAGSLEVKGDALWNWRGAVLMTATSGTHAIDAHCNEIGSNVHLTGGGTWELLGGLVLNDASMVALQRGTLRTNGYVIMAGTLRTQGHMAKRLEADGSIILVGSYQNTGTNFTLDAESSTLMLNGQPTHWDGTPIPEADFAQLRANCGGGPGQTPFVVTPSVTTDYNGYGVSCNGACDGAVAVTITGGVGPNFARQWAPGGPTTATWGPICAGNKLVTVIDLGQGVGCFANVVVSSPPPLGVIFFGLNPPTCAGVCNGTAVTFPGGGVGFGYVYDWNSGVESSSNPTQLCAGANTLVLTDANGCVFDTTFNIVLLPLLATLTNTPATCFGDCNGTAQLNVTGGTPNYTYNWEPDAPPGDGTPNVTGLCAGNYTVLVADANGCDTLIAFTVIQPNPITPNPTQTNATCSSACDGAASVAPTGTVGPYTYDWAPGVIAGDGTPNATGLCAGVYTVTITDVPTLCDTTITITIAAPPSLDVVLTTTDALCSGSCDGTAGITIAGGTPNYTIVWSPAPGAGQGTPNASLLCAGAYSVTVTDAAGCDTTILFTIDEPTPILPNEVITDITCNGACDGVIGCPASGGVGAYNYFWSPTPPQGQSTSTASLLCAGVWSVTITDQNGCDTTLTITLTEPPPLQALPSQTNVTCGNNCDGTASVLVSGGTPNYTYVWSPTPAIGQGTDSVSALCAGAISVLITDNSGCQLTVPFTILAAVPLQFSLQVTDASCPDVCDGTAGVIVTGGVPNYQYNWLPAVGGGQGTQNVTGLCPGAYTLTVTDAAGCDSTIAFSVDAPPAIVPNEVVNDAQCFGDCNGDITLSPTGGNGTFTYVWTPIPANGQGSNTATGLCAGSYQVVITSGACDTTLTILIDQPPALLANMVTTPPTCFGSCDGSATVNPSGGVGPYTIIWSPAPGGGQGTTTATGLCAGNWSVQVLDQGTGCDTIIPFNLTQPTAIDAVVSITNSSCGGVCDGEANVTVSGGAGVPYSFVWSPAPGGGQGTSLATGLCPGVYTVTITDGSGVCDTTIQFVINTPSGIQATGFVTDASCADVCDGVVNVSLIQVQFPVVLDWTPDPPVGDSTLNAQQLCPGTWILQITDGAGCDTIMVFQVGAPPAIIPNESHTDETCNGPCDGTASVAPTGGTGLFSFFWTPAPPSGQGTPTVSGLCAGQWSVLITDAAGCDTLVTFDVMPVQAVNASLHTTPTSCANGCDGTALVSPSGGNPPYTITWVPVPANGQGDTTATGLCGGNYTVNIADLSGCDTTISFSIVQPLPLAPALTITGESCSSPCSGAADVVVIGGTGSYTYDWQPSPGLGQGTPNASALCAGITYTLSITDSLGCDTLITFSVPAYVPIVPNVFSVPVNCNGGNDGFASTGPTGGTPPYTYFWSPNPPNGQGTQQISGLTAGVWQVLITDSLGCDTVASVLVTEPGPIVPNAVAVGPTCANGTDGNITFAPSGGTPNYTYFWSPVPLNGQGVSAGFGLAAGTWTITITDNNGCDSTFVYTLTAPPAIVLTTQSLPSQCQVCVGEASVQASGGSPGYTYQWLDQGGTLLGTDSVITGLCAGLYTVLVQDAGVCIAQAVVPITDSNGEVLTVTDGAPTCPTSCDGDVNVAFNCGVPTCTIAWFNAQGIDQGQSGNTLTNLCAGSYFVQITNGDGCISLDTANVIAPVGIVPNISSTPASCPGACDGSATAGPTGGVGPYDYDWTPDPPGGDGTPQATGLCAGVYTVLITDDAGCDTTASVLIIEPQPIAAAVQLTSITCAGNCDGTITVVLSGGTPNHAISWSPAPPVGQGTTSISGLCAGDWTATVTDANGCGASFTWTLTEPPPIVANITATPSQCQVCNGSASISASGGAGALNVVWFDANNVTIGSGNSVSNLCAGFYTASVTDALGCMVMQPFAITDSNGEVLTLANGQTTCANNCDGTVSVAFNCGVPTCSIAWFDGAGVALGQTTNAINNLCTGSYIVQVTNGDGCLSVDTAQVVPSQTLIVNLSSTLASCAGTCDGTATVGVSGGVNPYTFDWAPDPIQGDGTPQAIDLCAGVYTVSIADASGCDTTVSVLILEPPALGANAVITDAGCNGTCNGSIVVSPFGGSGAYTFTWTPVPSNGQGSNGAFGLCAGSYTLVLSDANGCDTSIVYTVGEPQAIVLNGQSVQSVCGVCNGEASVQASGGTGAFGYAWTDANNVLIGTDSLLTGLCSGLYTVAVTDASGCSGILVVPVSDLNGEATTTTGDTTTCLGSCDGTATVDFICGDVPCTIAWFDALGNDLNQSGNVVTPLCAGTYFVQVTNGSGCITIDTAVVASPPGIVPNLSTTPVSCFGACDGTATVGPTGGNGNFVIDWSPGVLQGDGTPQITALCAGIYQVSITDVLGCDTTASALIIEPQQLTDNATIDPITCNSVCSGVIDLNMSGGDGTYSYTWTPVPSNGQGTDAAIGICAGVWTVLVVDGNGCDSLFTYTITEPDSLLATIATTDNLCFGDCSGTAVVSIAGGSGSYTIAWVDGGGIIIAQDTSSVDGLCAGNYTLIVTDSLGCQSITTFSILQGAAIAPGLVFLGETCLGPCDGQANVNPTGGAGTFTVDWFDGGGIAIATDTSAVSALCAGNYSVLITDGNGCDTTVSFTILPYTFIVPNAVVQNVQCNGACDGSITLSPTGGIGALSFAWSPVPANGQGFSNATGLCAGDWSFTITDQVNCSLLDTITITEPPPITITIDQVVDASCATANDGAINITITGGTGSYGIGWTGPNSFVSSSEDIANLFAGVYVVTVTDANGCTAMATDTVNALSTVVADAGVDFSTCDGGSITLDGSASIGGTSFLWTDEGGNTVGTQAVVTLTNVQAGVHTYTLLVTDAPCTSSDQVVVTILDLPIADAGLDQTIFLGATTTIGGDPSGPPGSAFLWQPDSLVNNPALANPATSPGSTQWFVLTVTASNGCTDADSVLITVVPEVMIPDGFTPNGDGSNDTWQIDFMELFPECEVEVYSRWGELLFRSVGYGEPWDGKYSGGYVPVGTYYYVVNLNDPRYPDAFTGPLTVIR